MLDGVCNNLSKINKKTLVLPAVLIATVVFFSPLLWCDFINYDDPPFVTQNQFIQSGLTLVGIKWAFTTGYEANWIPLTWLSHMLDVQLFGLNPAGHHGVNVLFHSAATAILFIFLKRTTATLWQSAAVTLLFALHPLHVESVAWVAERKDVLSAFFWMLTIYMYSRYVSKPGIGSYLAVLCSFVLGLLSKPMVVTLPLILLLLDWWPLERLNPKSGSPATSLLRLVVEKIPLLLLSIGSSLTTYLVQEAAGAVSQGYTPLARVARACVSFMTYLYMTVWPLDLAVIYPFSRYPPAISVVYMSIFALVLISVVSFLFRKQCPYLVTGWGWFLIAMLPVIGLIQIGQHSVADRYTYIPLIGIFIMVEWGVSRFCEKVNFPKSLLIGITAIISVAMITLTTIQVTYWKNSRTLFEHTIAVTKDNWVAHNNLGLEYQAAGDLNRAISNFKQSILAKPSYALAYFNLGVVYRQIGDSKQALETFRMAVMFEPGNQEARLGLALASLDLGLVGPALDEYKKLETVDSEYAPVLLVEINRNMGDKKVP